MIKILFIFLLVNELVQTIPIVDDQNEDVMTALARLHQEAERIRRRLNPMPDLITFASNDIADRLKRQLRQSDEYDDDDDNTVYVNLKVNSEEDLPPKYVNLYIDTKRDMSARYIQLNDDTDYLDTKVIYLNINAGTNDQPNLSYRRYRRHHKN